MNEEYRKNIKVNEKKNEWKIVVKKWKKVNEQKNLKKPERKIFSGENE